MRRYLPYRMIALLSVVWLLAVVGSCTGLRKDNKAAASESCSSFVQDSTTIALNASHLISGAFTGQVEFWLPEPACVTLAVYDVLGREVFNLLDEEFQAGCHSAEWDCRDGSGIPVHSGVYFFQLKTENHSETKKIMLLR